MITNAILDLIVGLFNLAFSWLPDVVTLPTIVGYDIDTALVNGMGYVKSFFGTFWFMTVMFEGFLFLMGYYVIKMTLRLLLGNRIPQ